MKTSIYWMNDDHSGRLGIMPRPRGGDWLEDEIRAWRDAGVQVIVSLLENHEVEELDLRDEPVYCQALGLTYLSMPIPDRSLPESSREALDFARRLTGLLEDGKNLVIHCRQGIGRSSLMAATMLALRGMPAETAFEVIAKARGCAVPDTEEQRAWVIARFKDQSDPR
ncbi:MAG TPA: protein-tyrosine phosphatase family protein [Blastocatellia bacterium]|nr:protein-tyrosine phosphatase family protein [Blastocatellia bacterium]